MYAVGINKILAFYNPFTAAPMLNAQPMECTGMGGHGLIY